MRHVYVHVPFCRRRCIYCDFAIAVRTQVPAAALVEAITGECARVAGAGVGPLETLYLGGGTPSLLPPSALARLVEVLVSRLGLEAEAEITLEANPDDVTEEAVGAWRAAGVNRVSVGVQSTSAAVLAWMHRSHAPREGLAAVERLRRLGVPRVSADVIFGLPETLGADPVADCGRVVEAGAGHVSAYGLTIEEGTALGKRQARGERVRADADRYVGDFLQIHDRLTDLEFRHYEVSNYALVDEWSRHNRAYWQGKPYLGLGPSAHSFDGRSRWWNVSPWAEYAARSGRGTDTVDQCERLSPEAQRLERTYLALRQDEGMSAQEAGGLNRETVERALGQGWLRRRSGRLVCTPEGWLRLDALVTGLTTSPEGG